MNWTTRSLVCAAALTAAVSANAVNITIGGTPNDPNGEFSSVAGVTTIDFDAVTAADVGALVSGNFAIVNGSSSGLYAAPPNSGANENTSNYLTVPQNLGVSPQSADITLPGLNNYYGFYWGSIDDYNTVSFLLGGATVYSLTGTAAAALVPTSPSGTQSLASYFNFRELPLFDAVRFSSTNYAFETDNHAFGVVPAPATMALLGVGLLGIAFGQRRVKR